MKQLEGKVAVVTGAASGIGKGLARRCLREGMSVVLADVEDATLTQAEQEMSSFGNALLSVVTDVSKESDVRRLAQQTLDAFEAVHLLFNNAGVGAGQRCWDTTILDWQWTLGGQPVGCHPRRSRVRADHASAGDRVPHSQYGIHRRVHLLSSHLRQLPRVQARGCRSL